MNKYRHDVQRKYIFIDANGAYLSWYSFDRMAHADFVCMETDCISHTISSKYINKGMFLALTRQVFFLVKTFENKYIYSHNIF